MGLTSVGFELISENLRRSEMQNIGLQQVFLRGQRI